MQRILKCAPGRRSNWLSIAIVALMFSAPGAAIAVEVEGLYSAEVAIDPTDPESRDTAYERALQQVLVRVTGSEAAAVSPELLALFPNPARYVLQYRPAENNGLWVAMDGAAIEKVLRDRGLPVWGKERPLTMVWLAVDWGGGERELLVAEPADPLLPQTSQTAARAELRKRVASIATLRGLPLKFPTAGDLERADISLSDIWGGFHEELLDISRQNNAVSVLVGRARPGDAERSRWTYYSGNQRQQWNGGVEDAFQLLADTIAGEFVVSGNEPLALVDLTITNIRSANGYAMVQQIIRDVSVIDDYRVSGVSGDQIRFAVRVNGGARRLAGALGFNGDLEQLREDPATGMPLEATALLYAYRP